MKASPIVSVLALLVGVLLAKAAVAEYPFDPMIDSGPFKSSAHGDPLGYDQGYGYGDDYVPDPYLYETEYPPLDDLFGETAIWPGWVSGTYQPGTDRSLYDGEWFQPLYQDGRTMWYFDFRAQRDDNDASEFNVGTGVRTLTDPGWILGAYAFWDHLRSSNNNNFNQGLIGIEAMNVFWDARFNVYFPESGGKSVGAPAARISNGTVVVQSALERAYWGLDFEVGNLLWAWGPAAQHEVRGFVGAYHFDHSANATQSITGPRGRLEWRWHDLPYFGPGSRFTVGVTAQTDRVRDGQLFGFVRLRIPLDPWAHSRQRLSPLQRRMLDRVVRDVDVVSATSVQSEAAINPNTGHTIRHVHQIDANTPHVGDLLSSSQSDDVFVIDGSAGSVILPKTFGLKSGQSALGGQTMFAVRGATSGTRVTWNTGGTRPTVEFNGNAHVEWNAPPPGTSAAWDTAVHPDPPGFHMRDNTLLSGIDIVGGRPSVRIDNATDVTVADVNIHNFQSAGIEVRESSDISISNVSIENADSHSGFISPDNSPLMTTVYANAPEDMPNQPRSTGLFIYDANDVKIEQASIRDVIEGLRIVQSHDVSVSHTRIEETSHDGIRLINTHDVSLTYIELHDVAAYNWMLYRHNGQGNSRQVAAITGKNALATHIDWLTMTDVSDGVYFKGGNDLHISNSHITLRETQSDAYLASEHAPYLGVVDMAIWPEDAIRLVDVAGELTVRDSTFHLGDAPSGYAVIVENDASHIGDHSTNLQLLDNDFGDLGVKVSSEDSHQLNALLDGNTMSSVNLVDRSGAQNSIVFRQNLVAGEFYAASRTDSRLELHVIDNVLNGDPIGSIRGWNNILLDLTYTGNTSTAGATPLLINGTDGNIEATIGDNDHTPTIEGNVDVDAPIDGKTTGM